MDGCLPVSCVNLCVFLSPCILNTKNYDKCSENPVSLSDNPVILYVYYSNKCKSTGIYQLENVPRVTELSWTDPPPGGNMAEGRPVEITSCNYMSGPNVLSFYCFLSLSLLSSLSLLFPFPPASKRLAFLAVVSCFCFSLLPAYSWLVDISSFFHLCFSITKDLICTLSW